MPEQLRHLANKYEDTVNLQGAEAYRLQLVINTLHLTRKKLQWF